MRGRADPISALTALLARGVLTNWCRFCYELRLHRARGYGALKAILDILADEEGLTLTEISLRLRRTPGSTKDYLSWLEDVDWSCRVRSATASPIRCSVSGSGSIAARRADRGTSSARSSTTRSRACRHARPFPRLRSPASRPRRRKERAGDYRD